MTPPGPRPVDALKAAIRRVQEHLQESGPTVALTHFVRQFADGIVSARMFAATAREGLTRVRATTTTSQEQVALTRLGDLLNELDALDVEQMALASLTRGPYHERAELILIDLPGPAVDEAIYLEYRELMRTCGGIRPSGLQG